MDNHTLYEQVVPRPRKAKQGLISALIGLAAFLIPLAVFLVAIIGKIPYLNIVAFFLLPFTIYFAWYFITSLNIEFEYNFLSATLRVDKVIAKRRRKNMVKIDVKRLDDFFLFSDEEMSAHRFTKVYLAAADEFSQENYVAAFHDEAHGKCGLIFSPNEAFLEGMKPYFSADIRKKLFLAQKK